MMAFVDAVAVVHHRVVPDDMTSDPTMIQQAPEIHAKTPAVINPQRFIRQHHTHWYIMNDTNPNRIEITVDQLKNNPTILKAWAVMTNASLYGKQIHVFLGGCGVVEDIFCCPSSSSSFWNKRKIKKKWMDFGCCVLLEKVAACAVLASLYSPIEQQFCTKL